MLADRISMTKTIFIHLCRTNFNVYKKQKGWGIIMLEHASWSFKTLPMKLQWIKNKSKNKNSGTTEFLLSLCNSFFKEFLTTLCTFFSPFQSPTFASIFKLGPWNYSRCSWQCRQIHILLHGRNKHSFYYCFCFLYGWVLSLEEWASDEEVVQVWIAFDHFKNNC